MAHKRRSPSPSEDPEATQPIDETTQPIEPVPALESVPPVNPKKPKKRVVIVLDDDDLKGDPDKTESETETERESEGEPEDSEDYVRVAQDVQQALSEAIVEYCFDPSTCLAVHFNRAMEWLFLDADKYDMELTIRILERQLKGPYAEGTTDLPQATQEMLPVETSNVTKATLPGDIREAMLRMVHYVDRANRDTRV